MPASGGNRRFSNPSCCGRYRWCVSWNGTNAWQFHKLGLAWQSVETEREDNSIVALPCEICGELCPPDKLMEHQEQFIRERDGVNRSGSASEKNVCSQAILLPVLEIASGSVNNGREDDPFTFPNFTRKEPLMISWQTFSATWKIDDGHLKWWGICGRELDWQNFFTQELKYANLTRVCVSQVRVQVKFFFLPCFWKRYSK